MTSSGREGAYRNRESGKREHRGKEVRTINMNTVCKHSDNEYGGNSAIYIYTNSAHGNRIWDECEYINISNITRGE